MRCGCALAGADGWIELPTPEGERRHITSMFCDLVDSTELSQRLDPEELGAAIGAYQELCARSIAVNDGTIAQYLGDGLLVYFGYPRAHEDDPTRAVQAALEILREMPALNRQLVDRLPVLRGRPLEIRIGIHTGEVVVGALGRGRDRIAMGDTINITARLQGEAESGTVVISEATRHLVKDQFDMEGLGQRSLRGIQEPLSVYRVLARGARDDGADRTPFVGRDQEISLLLEKWEQVRQGSGQVVLLSGEPGIGKSRLLEVLHERLGSSAHLWLEGCCSPYYENSAFHPVLALLREVIGLEPDDPSELRAEKIEQALEPAGLSLDDVMPVLAKLLSVELPVGYREAPSNPEVQRRKSLELLTAWLFRLSEDEPVVLVVEDLHWVDPSTLELLSLLIEQVSWKRLLVILTYRPSFEPSRTPAFAPSSRVRQVALNPLTRQQTAQMVEGIRPGQRWAQPLVTRIVAKADGVPLFVEELARAVLESGASPDAAEGLAGFSIPSTLKSSLASRLDRLGPAKEIAQQASVLGRDFTHELLAVISEATPDALEAGLAELTRAGLLVRQGESPRASYSFRHALIRDAAYESLLRSARRRLHRGVAGALAEGPSGRVAAEPELIARHYDEAGIAALAIGWYQEAAEQAASRSATSEAIRHLSRGLELLSEVPVTAETQLQELNFQVQLGVHSMAAEGASDPDVERVFERAQELCTAIGPTVETGPALFGLSVFHQARGELETAVSLGDRMLAMAELASDSKLRVSADLSLGIPLFWTGQPARATSHLERAADRYDPVQHRSLAYAYGQDPAVSARSYLALCLWQLGSADRAVRQNEQAVADAVDDLTLAFALTWAAWVAQLRGDVDGVSQRAEAILEVAGKRGYVLWHGLGAVLAGWARVMRDGGPQGLEQLERGLAGLAGTGTHVVGPGIVGIYAEALTAAGRGADALSALDQALALAEQTKTPYMDAELRRQKGELLLRVDSSRRDEGDLLLHGALEEARARGLKAFELRAATSLAARMLAEGHKDEGRDLLGGVYNGLSEGKETADLRRARELLAILS